MRSRILLAVAGVATALALTVGGTPAFADGTDATFTTIPDGFISTPIVGEQSTANTLDWSPEPDSFSYQWELNGTPIAGETSYRFTPPLDDQGAALSATITAHKAGYTDATVTTPAVAVLGVLSHTAGQLTGTLTTGNLVSITDDTWTPADTTLSYRWYRGSGTEITSARDQSSYTLTDDDLPSLFIQVTGRHDGYAPQVETFRSGQILPSKFITDVPSIYGTVSEGTDLRVNANTYDWYPKPTTVSYQWFRDGVAIPGAVDLEYLPLAADVGHKLTFAVTGTHDGMPSATVVSLPTAPVAKGYFTAPAPTITGTMKVGYHLTAHPGKWHPSPEYVGDYDWYVNGVLDGSEHGVSYWPTVPGSVITVSSYGLTATNIAQRSPLSTPTPPIAAGIIKAPTSVRIGYLVSVGAHLGVQFSGASYDWPYTATWYIDGHEVSTDQHYTPTADDFHHRLSATVTLTVPGYPAVTSARSHGEVVNTGYFNFTPTLTSTPTVGQTVSVDYLPTDPAPTSVEIKWYQGSGRGHAKKLIHTGASFLVPAKYAGKHIWAMVIPFGKHMYAWPRDTSAAVVVR